MFHPLKPRSFHPSPTRFLLTTRRNPKLKVPVFKLDIVLRRKEFFRWRERHGSYFNKLLPLTMILLLCRFKDISEGFYLREMSYGYCLWNRFSQIVFFVQFTVNEVFLSLRSSIWSLFSSIISIVQILSMGELSLPMKDRPDVTWD